MGLLQNAATAPKLLENLHPADVGAAIGRPRATNRRPYGFERQNIGILQQIRDTGRLRSGKDFVL